MQDWRNSVFAIRAHRAIISRWTTIFLHWKRRNLQFLQSELTADVLSNELYWFCIVRKTFLDYFWQIQFIVKFYLRYLHTSSAACRKDSRYFFAICIFCCISSARLHLFSIVYIKKSETFNQSPLSIYQTTVLRVWICMCSSLYWSIFSSPFMYFIFFIHRSFSNEDIF